MKQDYIIIRNALASSTCTLLCERLQQLKKQGLLNYDSQTKKGLATYGDPVFEAVLEMIKPSIEKKVGELLMASFSYGRWYEPGSELKIHRDRDAANIGCTMTLDYSGDKPWPIYLSKNKKGDDKIKIELERGDMVLFNGCKLWHWRNTLQEQWQMQAMFFYIAQNDNNQHLKYDGRTQLGEKAIP